MLPRPRPLLPSLLLLCLPLLLPAQAPLFGESFEAPDADWTTTGYANVWYRNTGPTASNGTGPGGAADGDYYFYAEASGSRKNQTAHLTGGNWALPAGGHYALVFDYHMYGVEMGGLVLSPTAANSTGATPRSSASWVARATRWCAPYEWPRTGGAGGGGSVAARSGRCGRGVLLEV